MLATIKFAFHAIFSKPVRLFISFLLIVVTMCLTAVLILFYTFDFLAAEKRLYFSSDNPFAASEYLNYSYTYSFDLDLQPNEHFPSSVAEELTTELNSYGYGYAITQTRRAAQYVVENHVYSRIGAGTVLGAYHLDSFFGCYTSDMDSASYNAEEEGVNRLFDEAGNIAPFFPSYSSSGSSYKTFYKGTTCLVDGTEVSALDTFGYSVYGRLPETADEVVIPQSIYNSFAAYGYCDAGDIEQEDNVRGEVEEINSYDDIIGKTIKLGTGRETRSACIDATIVGVLTVDYEEHNWTYYFSGHQQPSEQNVLKGYTQYFYTYPLFFDIIVSQDYFDTYAEADTYADLITVSKNVKTGILDDYLNIALRWREEMTFQEIFELEGVYYGRINFYYGSGSRITSLFSLLYQFLFIIDPFTPFVYVALPFCFLLAGFLLYSSIENRRRQTGILRSLGAGGKQITLSLFLALAVFCLICAVAATALTGGFIAWLNNYFIVYIVSFNPFRLTWIVVLFLFGYPLLIAAAVAGLYFVRERSTTIISQLSPVAKKAGEHKKVTGGRS